MLIDKIGKSNIVQQWVRRTDNGKYYEKLNHNLPIVESCYTTLAYMGATQFNNKIPKERKKPMIYQSLIGGVAGLILSKKLDNCVKGHTSIICKELEKMNIPKGKNVVQGARILFPMLINTLVMRYIISVLSVPVSSWMAKQKKA